MVEQLHNAIRRPVPQGINNMNNNHLKTIIKDFLQKRRSVKGMPLAIVAVSGVLSTKDKRRIDEWDMVGHSLGA
ncbi:hypothetical protein M0R45_025285 [Rubus argutus]